MLFCETSNPFSQDILFIGCDIFPQIMFFCLHLIKHVLLGFNLVAPPVFILRVKYLCPIIMKKTTATG